MAVHLLPLLLLAQIGRCQQHSPDSASMKALESTQKTGPPTFVTPNNTVVEAQVGATATLSCEVATTVAQPILTWTKLKDDGGTYHLVSVDTSLVTWSYGGRLSILAPAPRRRDFRIRVSKAVDAGTYRCEERSTSDSILVHLRLREPKLGMTDESGREVGAESFYRSGESLTLQCRAFDLLTNGTLLWRQDGKSLNWDNTRKGVSVQTVFNSADTVSTLTIAAASTDNSGNYTCSLGRTTLATFVHVLEGEFLDPAKGAVPGLQSVAVGAVVDVAMRAVNSEFLSKLFS